MKYPCPLSTTGGCKYGGNKPYNYGFMSGTSSYCRHPQRKRFVYNAIGGGTIKCPKESENADGG